LSIAASIPKVAARILSREREVIALCRSSEFTLDKLRAFIERADH
jgi:hypothetical protein